MNEDKELNHIGTTTLFTERLMLRRFTEADAKAMFENWASDEEVAKYTVWNVNKTVEDTKLYLSMREKEYNSMQYYHWAIVYSETDELIGSISASDVNNYLKTCNIGYTLSKKYWNRGIATEAAKKIIEHLVENIGFIKITAYHDVDNKQSGKVLKKCGMEFVRRKNKYFFSGKRRIIECDFYCYEK